MALSDRHLIAAAVAVCACIAVTKLPPESERRNRRARQAPEIVVQNRAKERLREARTKLALLERRDSALAMAARESATSPGGPRTFYQREIPQGLRARLDSVLRRELAGIRTPLAAAPVIVLFVTDTAARGDGLPVPSRTQWIEAQYVLPAAADGRTCISIVRIGSAALNDRTRRNGRLMSEIALDGATGKLLGPCAFIGAYGPPGPAAGRWMDGASYELAVRSPAVGTDTLRTAKPTFTGDRETIVEVILRSTGWSPQRDWLHPDVIACAAGADDRCLAAIGAEGTGPSTVRPAALLRSSGVPFDRDSRAWGRSPLMGAGVWLLASLHDEAGAEAFARFWTSELPLDSAWAKATGAPLSTAARHWIGDTFEVGRPLRGPHPVALWLQLALAAAGVGGAILLRQRRTVSA